MKDFAPRTPAAKTATPAPSKGATLVDNRATAVAQRHMQETIASSPRQLAQRQLAPAPRPNRTGLPDNLKASVESLSGHSLDDVKVYYNSAKPAQLQAHAYAQGTDIHLGPGQEKHLPHEAWHVVQQKQGRVKLMRQMKCDVNINDDAVLEREADMMGAIAIQRQACVPPQRTVYDTMKTVVQRRVMTIKGITGQKNKYYSSSDRSKIFNTKEEAKMYDDKMKLLERTEAQNKKRSKKYRETRYAGDFKGMEKAVSHGVSKSPNVDYPPKPLEVLYNESGKSATDLLQSYIRAQPASTYKEQLLTYNQNRAQASLTEEDKKMQADPTQNMVSSNISMNHKLADSSVATIIAGIAHTLRARKNPVIDKAEMDALKEWASSLSDDDSAIETLSQSLKADDPQAHINYVIRALSNGMKNLRFGNAQTNTEILYAFDPNIKRSSGRDTPLSANIRRTTENLIGTGLISKNVIKACVSQASYKQEYTKNQDRLSSSNS